MKHCNCSIFSRRFSSEKSPTVTVASFLVDAFYQTEPDNYSGKFFFFFRQTTECMRSGHFFYRTTKLLDRQAETHLS